VDFSKKKIAHSLLSNMKKIYTHLTSASDFSIFLGFYVWFDGGHQAFGLILGILENPTNFGI
jgi:hypothetical protein